VVVCKSFFARSRSAETVRLDFVSSRLSSVNSWTVAMSVYIPILDFSGMQTSTLVY
jgi:hypothetical protein